MELVAENSFVDLKMNDIFETGCFASKWLVKIEWGLVEQKMILFQRCSLNGVACLHSYKLTNVKRQVFYRLFEAQTLFDLFWKKEKNKLFKK